MTPKSEMISTCPFVPLTGSQKWHHLKLSSWRKEIKWGYIYIYLFIWYIYIWVYIYANIHICFSRYVWNHMGVDQNKGIWDSYNRRSTTNQSRSQRCQSREASIVSDIFCAENRQNPATCHSIETWRERGLLRRVYQSRGNRELIADFTAILGKLNWSWLLDF